jgi:hypothetical protein
MAYNLGYVDTDYNLGYTGAFTGSPTFQTVPATVYPSESIVLGVTAAGATQGTGGVTIGGVAQTVTAWSDTSITITCVLGVNSYGAATALVLTTGAAQTATTSILIVANTAGAFGYVEMSNPNTTDTSSVAFNTTPTVVTGDQFEWEDFNALGNLVIDAEGFVSTVDAAGTFRGRFWDATDSTWGAVANFTVAIRVTVVGDTTVVVTSNATMSATGIRNRSITGYALVSAVSNATLSTTGSKSRSITGYALVSAVSNATVLYTNVVFVYTQRKGSSFDVTHTLGTITTATLNGIAITINTTGTGTVNLTDISGITASGEYPLVLGDGATTETYTVQLNVVGISSYNINKDGVDQINLTDIEFILMVGLPGARVIADQIFNITTNASGDTGVIEVYDVSLNAGDVILVLQQSVTVGGGLPHEATLVAL